MSGIYIKGFAMPKKDPGSYKISVIYRDKDGKVYATEERGSAERHEVIPVPDHGRLIDADALETAIGNEIDECRWNNASFSGYRVRDLVDEAPTVISASKEGEI